ncbi:MAG: plasmid recombination protein [Eubacterium sp.]|nr:plasmid recombination protein [Eubacterium sp.]
MEYSSISIELGKGVINHNNRKFIAENVDREKTKNNIEYKNIPIEEAYHILFDDALQRYNDKQTRKSRRIPSYYEHIKNSKQENLFYEIIVQVGNREDMGVGTENEELAKKILDEYMYNFEKRNPYLFVFNAHLHMDEATPHLHIDFIPFTTECDRGLDTRVSLKRALLNEGFYSLGKSDTEAMAWMRNEKEELAAVMKQNEVEWENQGNNRDHLSVLEFKKEQRSKEVEELEAHVSTLENKFKNLSMAIETVTAPKNNEEFEEEFVLPEPQRLETAKSYKGRIDKMFGKLKALVKSVLVKYFELENDYHELYEQKQRLSYQVYKLDENNKEYQNKNNDLRKQLRDYRLLRKVLGSKEVNHILEEAKRGHRRRNREWENTR